MYYQRIKNALSAKKTSAIQWYDSECVQYLEVRFSISEYIDKTPDIIN